MKTSATREHFQELLNSEQDLLALVIKAHYSIDSLLDETLLLRMPHAGAVELRRVSFLLKVDFLVGLGVLRQGVRPLFDKVNSIRNRFAHNPYASFDRDDASKVKQMLLAQKPIVVPSSFASCEASLKILQMLFAVCFINLEAAFGGMARRSVENAVVSEMARDTLSKHKNSAGDVAGKQVDLEFRQRVSAMMKARFPSIDFQK